MFKDKNLKLVIVDEAVSLGEQYCIGWDKDFDEFCQLNFGRTVELGHDINTEIEQFFLNLEIPEKDLLAIEYLCLDADHATFACLTEDLKPHFEYIDIHSLEGIEHCVNLQKLNLGSLAQRVDMQPLIKLSKLETLIIDYYSATHYEALLSIKSLKKLEIYNWHSFTPEDKKILASVLQLLESRCELVVAPVWKNSIFSNTKTSDVDLRNSTHTLVQKYADKLLGIQQHMSSIAQQQAGGKVVLDFQSPVWTVAELTAFEQQYHIELPDEYQALLLSVGEISKDYFRGLLNVSLRNRLKKDYVRMKKKAISTEKIHNIGSLYGNGWIREEVFTKLKEEDRFRLYRKVPLFATDARYDTLFGLKSWDSYKNGCLALNESTYLILNGEFAGEIWKYDSEPEGEYAPSKYRECFTPIDENRTHLLDFISTRLADARMV
jgi:hypothetical protein